MRARDCDLGTNIAQFSRFQENFHEENWSISHCKLNTDCLPLVEQQKRKQAQQTGFYVDKYSEDSLFCLEGLSFVVPAHSFAMCGQARSVIAENKRSTWEVYMR